ncbi:MAG: YIP1 family protein [Terriglobales bacterium]
MNAALPATVPAVPEEVMSQPARIVNTFVAPSKVFSGLHRNASWWMAWLLTAILTIGFVYTMDVKIGMEQIAQQEMARSPRSAQQMEKMSPEQREQALKVGMTIARVFAYGAPVMGLVVFLLIAAVLMATFNFGLGTRVPFKVALAITVYSFLPTLLSTLLAIFSLMFVDPEGFNARNPVASNLAAWIMSPDTSHKFLYTLATGLDIFSLWIVALLGTGFSVQGKVKRSTAIVVVLCWFVLLKLAGAAWAGLA